jgi:hypothetical protein
MVSWRVVFLHLSFQAAKRSKVGAVGGAWIGQFKSHYFIMVHPEKIGHGKTADS